MIFLCVSWTLLFCIYRLLNQRRVFTDKNIFSKNDVNWWMGWLIAFRHRIMDLIKRSFLFFCGLKLPGIVALATLYAGFLTQALGQSRVCNDPTPTSNLNEMFDAIYACWVPPEDTEGLVVTLQFILHKDGQIRGKVVVTAARPQEDSPRRQAFIDSAIDAVKRAAPVPFTEEFASRIAGRPLGPRFIGTKIIPETKL